MKNQTIYELIQASYAINVLYVLTKNSVFDDLLNSPKSLTDLASTCNVKEDVLGDFLLLAVSLNFLKFKDSKFSNAKKGLLLTTRGNHWLRYYLLVWGEQLNPSFSHLNEYLKTGENAFKLANGDLIWDFYGKELKQNEIFVEFMSGVTTQAYIPSIVQELHIGESQTLLDVGGGKGSLVCSLLARHSHLKGFVYDQPSNSGKASLNIESFDLLDRCSFIGGNMFSNVPAGYDLYTIKHVLHDWDDQNALQILNSISDAMRFDSKLIIIEGLMDREFSAEFKNPEFLHTRNIEQKVWTIGKVRNSRDFEKLCSSAKLKISKITHSSILDMSYITCIKTRQ